MYLGLPIAPIATATDQNHDAAPLRLSVTQPKGEGGEAIDSLCKELTNRWNSLKMGFLNERPDRAPKIPAGRPFHFVWEKRGDLSGRVRIMAPNRLLTCYRLTD